MTDWDDDILSVDKTTDENIIELTDIVKENFDPVTQEDVIELTDIVENETADLDLDMVEEGRFNSEENFELEDDISFHEGLELEVSDPADDLSVEPRELTESDLKSSMTQEQVEAALERVIEKKFAAKIETILFEVMEKVIEREIVKIRESLLKDLDQIGNG